MKKTIAIFIFSVSIAASLALGCSKSISNTTNSSISNQVQDNCDVLFFDDYLEWNNTTIQYGDYEVTDPILLGKTDKYVVFSSLNDVYMADASGISKVSLSNDVNAENNSTHMADGPFYNGSSLKFSVLKDQVEITWFSRDRILGIGYTPLKNGMSTLHYIDEFHAILKTEASEVVSFNFITLNLATGTVLVQ